MKLPDEEKRKELRQFFGIPSPKRKPIPSNSFNTLVKLYSLLPDQSDNPLAQFAHCPEYNTFPAWPKGEDDFLNNYGEPMPAWPKWDHIQKVLSNNPGRPRSDDVCDNSVSQGDKKTSDNLVRPAGVEVHNMSFHNEEINNGTAGNLGKDGALSDSRMTVDELSRLNNTKVMGDMAFDEEGTHAGTDEFHEVHQDLSGLQRFLMDEPNDLGMLKPPKDVYLDLAIDFGADMLGNKSVTVESSETGKSTVAGNTKEHAVGGENKGEDVQVNRSTTGGDPAKVQAPQSVEKGDQFSVIAKGKTKKVKKSVKGSKSGKHKHSSVENEAYSSMNSGGTDPVVHGKIPKPNAHGPSKSLCTRKDENSWPVSPERLQYTREQLLCLRKMAFVREDIVKVVRDIGAKLYEKHQNFAGSEFTGANRSSKEQLCPREDKKVEEMGSSILNKKKRGSTSEAKKEKKKAKKRKMRAELNRKLGVKRLKLEPIQKPKVVQHCRHYLKGRCQEGEKCKFSHDVIPLTKAKPCCHFARQACMKGDDCPFDHQLSKYPCKNFVVTGFCNRGPSCLFSHKIPHQEGSGSTVAVPHHDTPVGRLDISKSKQQLDASVSSFSSGIAKAKNLKENLALQTRQPVNAPKGLSFFSFGKSQFEGSDKHKELDLSQQNENTMFERTSLETIGDKKQSSPLPRGDSSRYFSFGKPLLNDSAKYQPECASRTSVEAVGIDNRLNQGMSGEGIALQKMGKGTSTLTTTNETTVHSYGGASYDKSGGKSVSVFSPIKHTVPQLCFRENESPNASAKSKEKQKQLWGSPSSGQSSAMDGLAMKSTPTSTQKALLSTLAFAAKYESGIKTNSLAVAKEINENKGTVSGTESRQNESSQASAILQFLYGGVDREK